MQRSVKQQREKAPSRKKALFTLALLILWLILMFFGSISTLNPKWLSELSRPGIKVESRHCKDYGDNLLQHGNYQMAILQYQECLKMRPDYVGVLVNMAVAYSHVGNEARAAQILKDALQMDTSQRGVIYYNFGELLEKQGKSTEAISYYKQALGSELEQVLVYRKLGTLYLGLGQYEEAREAFEMTLAIQTDLCTPYKNMLQRSVAIYEDDTTNLPIIEEQLIRDVPVEDLTQYDLEIIRQTQQSDPEIAKTHNHLGFICARLDDIPGAIEHFQKSLQIWPGNIDATRNLRLLQQLQEKR